MLHVLNMKTYYIIVGQIMYGCSVSDGSMAAVGVGSFVLYNDHVFHVTYIVKGHSRCERCHIILIQPHSATCYD